MRKVTVATFVSLDGVMQAPGGPEEDAAGGFRFGGWQAPFDEALVSEAVNKTLAAPFDLLLGRRTYEIFSSYWPKQENGPAGEISRLFNKATKYVATSSDKTPLPWTRSVALHDPAKDVARLRKEDGPVLQIWGSRVLIQTLQTHGLIDEFVVMTYPLLLGKGKKLFGEGVEPSTLKLTSSKTGGSGVIVSTYQPAGPVKTGTVSA